MSVIEIFKPSFELFHDKLVIVFQEPKGPVRIAVNMFEQYNNWLNAWSDPYREKHAPAAAFWETPGPAICRALRSLPACVGLFFEWESDRKVSYRWISRKPESPVSYSHDWYCICSVNAECNSRTSEGHITVTMPTDEDVTFYFQASTMKDWLKQKPAEEVKP